jgi:hypothetical protein
VANPLVQMGYRCPLLDELERGFEARVAPADWRQQLGL